MSFVQVPPDSTGKLIATNEIAGQQYQIVNLADATGAELSPLTDAQLRATPVEISGAQSDGATPTGQALVIAGVKSDNTVKTIEVNASGHVNIADGGGSITVDSTALTGIDTKLGGVIDTNTSNVKGKFRDAFEGTTLDATKWTSTIGMGDLVYLDGNTVGTSYLVISKSPLNAGSETNIETVPTFEMPLELSTGVHLSQRTIGQEFSIEVVDTDAPDPDVTDLAIASISQATTTLTVNTTLAHGLVVGKAIGIRGVSDSRLNFPQLVVATTPSATQFTVTAGPAGNITSQTIGAVTNGFVYFRERLGRSKNGVSQIFENVTATNASLYVRSASGDSFPSGTVNGNQSATVSSTASIQTVNAAYNYGFTPTTEQRICLQADRINWLDSPIDSLTIATNRLIRTQVAPDSDKTYKLRLRTKNQPSMPCPVARIVSAVKTGTTTATITTDVAHGLSTTSFVQVWGVRDQAATAFPNLAVATQVASVPTATTFTIVIGTAATVTSYGGFVSICNGTALISSNGAIAQVAQSVSVNALGEIVLVGSAAWAGLLIGDSVQLHGVNNSTTGAPVVATNSIDGAYKIANIVTTTLTLLPIDGLTRTTLGSTNCGGGVIKRTDMRVSFVRVFDYERFRVESAPRAGGDQASAIPMYIQGGGVSISGSVTTTLASTTVTPTVPATTYILNSAATTNEALIITGTSGLQAFYATNTGATAAFVKLYNKATAPISTDIPAMIIPVPAAVAGVCGTASIPIGFSGHRFLLGLGIRITGAVADNDVTAVAAGQVKVMLSRTV